MPVYRHKKKWMYDFWKNEVRYRKGGYSTKQKAVEAEAKARATARMINMDFVQLCESRLKELEVKRSRQHFKEMKSFLKNITPIFGRKTEVSRKDIVEYPSVPI